MMALGPLAFVAPWILAGLVTLPVLWWLLRIMPPAPRLVPFPAIRLLFGLKQTEETPHRTPWWLLLLRLFLATIVILALAHPLLNPGAPLGGSGPLLLVIDDGWAAARQWPDRQAAMRKLIDQAEQEGKAVMLLPTAQPETGEPVHVSRLLRANDARQVAQAMEPKPWATNRLGALAALTDVSFESSVNAVWLSDGLDDQGPSGTETPATQLMRRLQSLGSVRLITHQPLRMARLLLPPEITGTGLTLKAARAAAGQEEAVTVTGLTDDGRVLARQPVRFASGAATAETTLELPVELRNRLARLAIEGEDTAGAVVMLDERYRRRPVGLVSGETAEMAQPLLGDLFYIERALTPFAELRKGNILDLIKRELAVLVLADIGDFTNAEDAAVEEWVTRGGVLLRFAGPRLAEGSDRLLPATLRRGGRSFGGVMSWALPLQVETFEAQSPFAGLPISPEVTVKEQVLADPSPDLSRKVWARLSDGTPLVTADRKGAGWLILVHTTANASWSNLALSGVFVDMLRRIVSLSQGVAGADGTAALPPLLTLDGFGRLGTPPGTTQAIRSDLFAQARPGPRTPPGYYGTESSRRALNLGGSVPPPRAMGTLPSGVTREDFETGAQQIDLKPWFLIMAMLVLLLDFVIALILRGLMPGMNAPSARASAATAALATLMLIGMPLNDGAQAQGRDPGRNDEAFILKAGDNIHLAYVVTGVLRVDEDSRAGLAGLTLVLLRRTSVEAGDPIGVNLDRDDLSFFPLLYWPMSEEQEVLSDTAIAALNQYMRNGGTILFDTRDQGVSIGEGTQALRRIAGGLDLPPIIPVPAEHVLTKAFYLMKDFPGRYAGGTLWVQQPDLRVNDGVSPVVVGGNDWAAAWAIDAKNQPLYPVVPGGDRQREMAYRFGVNLVMYALTGNYKADQVHVPQILERLGQ
ncbi:MAG: DUF4159 domain-containing protein [Alphaproteobacteria bacterium]|nr:DUF4159 domain-containing protein [Alphaproteobacteria bacterium]